jgi:hypothetical protein
MSGRISKADCNVFEKYVKTLLMKCAGLGFAYQVYNGHRSFPASRPEFHCANGNLRRNGTAAACKFEEDL